MMRARCPACGTVFRVRAEQLRARQGQVRCGHCYSPFNALEHLLEEGVQATAPGSSTPGDAPAPRATPQAATEAPRSAGDERFFILEERVAQAASRPSFDLDDPFAPAKPSAAEESVHHLDFEFPDTLLPARKADKEDAPSFPAAPIAAPFQVEPAGSGITPVESPEPTPAPAVIRPTGRRGFKQRNEPFPALDIDAAAAEMENCGASSALPDESPRVEPGSEAADATERTDPTIEPAQPPFAAHEPQPAPQPAVDDTAATEDRSAERTEPGAESQSVAAADPWSGEPTQPHEIPAEWEHATEAERLDAIYGPPPAAPARSHWLWGVGSGLLLAVLLAQAAYLFRDGITRNWPALRPVYVSLCAELGCTLNLPREASLIGIETSDLESETSGRGRYVLSAVIRNRAAFPQAWPHLELTLTDARDLPAARRVIAPEEWVPAARQAEGFPARGDQSARLPFDAPDVEAVGYRIYAFYP